jgi:hypothetical protein
VRRRIFIAVIVLVACLGSSLTLWRRQSHQNVAAREASAPQLALDAAKHSYTACRDCSFLNRLSAGFRSFVHPNRPTIIGGNESTTADFPGVGALLSAGSPLCTATCLTRYTVLTAAHCVYSKTAADLQFKLGVNVNPPGGGVAIVGYITPSAGLPGPFGAYDPKTRDNDIALVYLASPVSATTYSLGTIASATSPLRFVGYGYNDRKLSGRGIQRYIDLPIRAEAGNRIAYGGPSASICLGDSGGPAFALNTNQVVAVTSDTISCASGRSTTIAPYASWIKSLTQ